MESASYVGLNRQNSLRRELALIANNIANMHTNGFRAQRPLFTEHRVPTGEFGETMSFVQDSGARLDLTPGTLQSTGNQLDFAIQGNGYFVVSDDETNFYTRNGAFTLNENSELVDQAGNRVLNTENNPIIIPPGTAAIGLSSDGSITADGAVISRMQVVEFGNEQELRPIGHSLYETDLAPVEAEDSVIKQGMIEQSNVQPILEMTRMIEVGRAYQSAQNMLQGEHERQRRAIQRIMSVA